MPEFSKESLSGMTTNERLFVCGLLDEFDRAFEKGDQKKVREILKKIYVDDGSIDLIVQEIAQR